MINMELTEEEAKTIRTLIIAGQFHLGGSDRAMEDMKRARAVTKRISEALGE